jgi:hypothetical protein
MRSRYLALLLAAGIFAAAAFAATARATPPEMFHFSESGSEPGFIQCNGFEIDLETTGTRDLTLFFDDTGEVIRFLVRIRATDILTNSVTGKTVVNRGVFQNIGVRVEDTDEFMQAIVGFRFMATSPTEGLLLQDVGRFVHTEDGEIVFIAGQHHVPDGPEGEAAICAALA